MNTVTSSNGQTEKRCGEIARRWLMKFVAVTGKEASPALFDIWDEQLRDIPPEKLGLACDHLMKAWRYPNLPTPGDVRAQIDQANANGLQLEAEQAWLRAFDWVQRYFHPDLGVTRGAPELPPVIRHAIDAAGGMRSIEGGKESELPWMKKRFIADYVLIHETRQFQPLLSNREARRILVEVTGPAKPKPKQLKSPAPEGNLPPRDEVRTVLERVAEIPSEEEWERRKQDLKRRANEWAARQGITVQAVEQATEN